MKSLSDLKKWLDMHNIDYGDNFDKHLIKDLNFSDDLIFADLQLMIDSPKLNSGIICIRMEI